MNLEIEKKLFFLDDMSEILNYDFITNTVGWVNHGDPLTVFHNGKINKWVYFNDDTNEIKEFEFDEVHCYGTHSFSGTHYDYFFYLNGENVNVGQNNFSDTKEIFVKELQKREEIKLKKETFKIENITSPSFCFDGIQYFIEDKMFENLSNFQKLIYDKMIEGFETCYLYSIEYKNGLFFIRYKFL